MTLLQGLWTVRVIYPVRISLLPRARGSMPYVSYYWRLVPVGRRLAVTVKTLAVATTASFWMMAVYEPDDSFLGSTVPGTVFHLHPISDVTDPGYATDNLVFIQPPWAEVTIVQDVDVV